MEKLETKNLLNLDETIANKIFENLVYPWEVLPNIGEFIIKLGNKLDLEKFEKKSENIWIARSAKVAQTAYITGPCIIDEFAEIRHCAFIRGNAIVRKKCSNWKFDRIKKCNYI